MIMGAGMKVHLALNQICPLMLCLLISRLVFILMAGRFDGGPCSETVARPASVPFNE